MPPVSRLLVLSVLPANISYLIQFLLGSYCKIAGVRMKVRMEMQRMVATIRVMAKEKEWVSQISSMPSLRSA